MDLKIRPVSPVLESQPPRDTRRDDETSEHQERPVVAEEPVNEVVESGEQAGPMIVGRYPTETDTRTPPPGKKFHRTA